MKKTLIFIVLLTLTIFLISSCSTPEARFGMPKSSIGGSGGPTTIECYEDSECYLPALKVIFCDGDSACESGTTYSCVNPGAYNSYCASEQYTDCTICPNGCSVGHCIGDSDITYEGILSMLNNAEIIETMTNGTWTTTCNDICSQAGKTCIHAENQYQSGSYNQWIFHPMPCNAMVTPETDRTLHCWCAEPQ